MIIHVHHSLHQSMSIAKKSACSCTFRTVMDCLHILLCSYGDLIKPTFYQIDFCGLFLKCIAC